MVLSHSGLTILKKLGHEFNIFWRRNIKVELGFVCVKVICDVRDTKNESQCKVLRGGGEGIEH